MLMISLNRKRIAYEKLFSNGRVLQNIGNFHYPNIENIEMLRISMVTEKPEMGD